MVNGCQQILGEVIVVAYDETCIELLDRKKEVAPLVVERTAL
jgi:hypothetical protein